MQDSPPLLTLERQARTARVPIKWLRDEAIAGRIPCLMIGKRRLFNPQAVQQALADRAATERCQGSEYPAVVIPIHTQHFPLLQRNLLYTAMTRGKRLVVLVGTKKAVAMAVKRADVSRRVTTLAPRLVEAAQE